MGSVADMTSRERILAACRMQEVDRVPWSPLLDGYFLSGLPGEPRPSDIGIFRETGADATPKGTTVETLKIITEAVEKYGGLPFSLT